MTHLQRLKVFAAAERLGLGRRSPQMLPWQLDIYDAVLSGRRLNVAIPKRNGKSWSLAWLSEYHKRLEREAAASAADEAGRGWRDRWLPEWLDRFLWWFATKRRRVSWW